MSAFNTHRKAIVEDYLQTVFVIDDGANLGLNKSNVSELSIPNGDPLITPLAVVQETQEESSTQESGSDSHQLDSLALTNAFYRAGIVPGLYQPQIKEGEKPEKFAESIIKVSQNSDVIILDWMLKKSRSDYSKSIVKKIIEIDKAEGGRLRSIVIYTGENTLQDICEELLVYLDNDKLTKDGDFRIIGEGLVIEFYCKEGSGSVDRDRSESDLPNLVIESFSLLLNGLAPSFAVRSASEIRKNIGRLTSKFSHKIDPGYLSHRSLIPSPEDAELFMLEIFVSHLRSLLAISKPDIECLGISAIQKWVDENEEYLCRDIEVENVNLSLTKESIIEILSDGYDSSRDDFGLRKVLFATEGEKGGISKVLSKSKIKDILGRKSLHELFNLYSRDSKTLDSIKELAVLSLFKRTRTDIHQDLPYLTQGTVVYCLGTAKYYLCVTPKCDTLRLKEKRKFSFAPLTEIGEQDKGRFDIIIRNKNLNGYISLSTQNKFHDLHTVEFAPDPTSERVQCEKNESQLMFSNTGSFKFQWIGDLEELQAQNRVVGLVGDLSRTGVDEMEWLRQQ
ncbi:response regulator receiver domain [Vibrio splendidus]